MSRLAQLEEKYSAATKAAKSTPSFDARAFSADPVGEMAKLGVPVEHVTKILVANAIGDAAPAHLKEYAQTSQQISNTVQPIQAAIESLGRRLDEVSGGPRRESFKTLAADKSKYPHLATAIAADPSLFGEDAESHKGDAAELAQRLEAQLAKLAPALGVKISQPASDVSADTQSIAQGQQAKPAPTAESLQGTPPPIQQPPNGTISTPDLYAQLKAEVVRQYETK